MLRSVLTGLATTAALVVTEDTYFAGQSPPVYPSRMYLLGVVNSFERQLKISFSPARCNWGLG